MKLNIHCLLVLLVSLPGSLFAAIIGTNVPAHPLSAESIATLPAEQQPVWLDYLARSQRQKVADQNFLWSEMKAHGLKQSITPPASHSAKDLPLDLPAAWYAGTEADKLADMAISYQTPAGGWSKNLNVVKHLRAPGEAFATDNNNLHPTTNDFDQALDMNWHYVGTFDNGATIAELRFLAKVAAASTNHSATYQAAFRHGLDYIFNAQYPNGGWPQVWPLEGGYHDAITLNDDAMLNILALVQEIGRGNDEFAWVPAELRTRAQLSFQRGIDCLLAAQIHGRNGQRTVWCQQYDMLTLQPASARNYEMPAAASSESANFTLYLMKLPQPSANEVAAIRAAVAWFDKTKIMDHAFKSTGGAGRKLLDLPGNGPIWARYYDIATDRPIFGDRDKTIHDDVNDLSKERRNGYGWYHDNAKRVLEHYRRWSQENGA